MPRIENKNFASLINIVLDYLIKNDGSSEHTIIRPYTCSLKNIWPILGLEKMYSEIKDDKFWRR